MGKWVGQGALAGTTVWRECAKSTLVDVANAENEGSRTRPRTSGCASFNTQPVRALGGGMPRHLVSHLPIVETSPIATVRFQHPHAFSWPTPPPARLCVSTPHPARSSPTPPPQPCLPTSAPSWPPALLPCWPAATGGIGHRRDPFLLLFLPFFSPPPPPSNLAPSTL